MPEEYARIKSGDILPDIDAISIGTDAHPGILLEPVHFRNASYYAIIMAAGRTQVRLFTRDRAVRVAVDDADAEFDVPDNYNDYQFHFGYTARITDAYIASILKCANATSLKLSDERLSLAASLFARVHEMKAMAKLTMLDLAIHRDDRNDFAFGPFFELAGLQYVTFRLTNFFRSEYQEFVAAQKIPEGWQRRRDLELNYPESWHQFHEVIHTYYRVN